jgi:hypothetical protein
MARAGRAALGTAHRPCSRCDRVPPTASSAPTGSPATASPRLHRAAPGRTLGVQGGQQLSCQPGRRTRCTVAWWPSTPAGRWSRPGTRCGRVRPMPILPSSARDVAQRGESTSVGDQAAGTGRPTPSVAEWQRAEDVGPRRRLGPPRSVVATVLGTGLPLTEPSLAHHLYAVAPRHDPHWWCRPPCPSGTSSPYAGSPGLQPPRVLSNRGANGIDGVVSTATGVSLAGLGARPWPSSAIWPSSTTSRPWSGPEGFDPDLTVVVADNRRRRDLLVPRSGFGVRSR